MKTEIVNITPNNIDLEDEEMEDYFREDVRNAGYRVSEITHYGCNQDGDQFYLRDKSGNEMTYYSRYGSSRSAEDCGFDVEENIKEFFEDNCEPGLYEKMHTKL